jgi:hypothetical protein
MNSQGSTQSSPGLKLWRLILILTVYGLVVLTAPLGARGGGLDRVEGIELDLPDLIADWAAYRDLDVVVQGQFHCVNETFCDLIPASGLRRTVSVNISHLEKEKRNYLQISCSQQDCLMSIFATVGSWELYAFSVQKIGS